MTDDPLARLRRFLGELKRRKVYRVAATYVVVAAGAVQLVNVVIPASRLPGWSDEFFLGLAVFGFPIALVLAWAFEVTPEGVRRTEAADRAPEVGSGIRWVSLVLLVLAAGGVWAISAAENGKQGTRAEGSGDGTGAAETAPARGQRGDERSIAVLPFDNLSGTEEAQPFVNGIHGDLLARLSNLSGLRVISRTSVLPYRETELSLPAIADSLGVRWIVEGGVQQAGDQVQVNAQLIQAEEDVHRWAETYRRRLTTENIFTIQRELTKKIARSLETELSPEEEARVAHRATEDLEAYRLYSRGRALLVQRTDSALHRAEDLFRRALARDSAFALAWSGLADSQAFLWFYDYAPPESVSDAALRAARRAVELGPELGEAHASLGIVRSLRHEGPSALRELQRAVELTPSHPEAHIWLSWIRLVLGRPREALPPARRAVELDPTAPSNRVFFAEALVANGQPGEGLQQARRGRAMRRDYGMAHFMVGLAFHHLGRFSEAEASWTTARSVVPAGGSPSVAEVAAAMAAARAATGDTAGARAVASGIDREENPFAAGLASAAVGDVDGALRALRSVREWDSIWTEHVRYFFPGALGPVREDPRYEALLRQINRAWGLNPDGSLPREGARPVSSVSDHDGGTTPDD